MSEADPKKKVDEYIEAYGSDGQEVLSVFNTVDPLAIYRDDAPDGYVEYATRCMQQLVGKRIIDLKREDLVRCITDSFEKEQLGTFVTEKQIQTLVNYLDPTLKNPATV